MAPTASAKDATRRPGPEPTSSTRSPGWTARSARTSARCCTTSGVEYMRWMWRAAFSSNWSIDTSASCPGRCGTRDVGEDPAGPARPLSTSFTAQLRTLRGMPPSPDLLRPGQRRATDESACTPGPVHGRLAASRWAVIHLGLPLPAGSSGLPAGIGRAALERLRRTADRTNQPAVPFDLAPGGVYRATPVTRCAVVSY